MTDKAEAMERETDEAEAMADLRKAVQEGASDEWLLGFVRGYPFAAIKAQPAPTEAQGEIRHRAPANEEEAIQFIGNHYDLMEENDDLSRVRFTLTVHDLLSAFNWWEPVDLRLIQDETKAQGEDSARPSQQYQRITAPGQVKVGDQLRFTLGDDTHLFTAKQLLHAGTDKEEIIYNKRQNYYLITSMAIANRGSQKNCEYLAAPQPQEQSCPSK